MRHEFNLSAEQQTALDVLAQENGETSGKVILGYGRIVAMPLLVSDTGRLCRCRVENWRGVP
jgi:hypothetical protein